MKVGLDDYFVAGHTVEDLLALASSELRAPPVAVENGEAAGPYRSTLDGLLFLKPTAEGAVRVPLTNFTAKITADVAEDDGSEIRRHFEIEAALRGRHFRFAVPAPQFNPMNWATEHLGAEGIVYPGFGIRDHARCAVQMLSGSVQTRKVYAHTGWRKIGEVWVYLHAGGGIGQIGQVLGIEVNLPGSLAGYNLPAPPQGDDLAEAIRASLSILTLAPGRITVPVLSAIFRAATASADFSLHFAGPTGVFKSELAALAQQHYGSGLDARHLPGSWSSTGNALEGLGFAAKDALFVVDDFAPTGSQTDVQRYHREADRFLRAQGNNSGRGRMRADGTLRPAKPPRGLTLSTGEDIPRGQSLQARIFALEIGPGDIPADKLTTCQRDAAAGLYAQALSAFLRWMASRHEEIRKAMPGRLARLRGKATVSGQHRRTPDIVAHLAYGLDLFLDFALDAGVLSSGERAELRDASWKALGEAAQRQAQHQAAAEPARRFLELLGAAITTGKAHVAGARGGTPDNPSAWGWREVGEEWRPFGDLVGWEAGDDLFLEPEAAYAVVQRLGRDGGEGISIGSKTLHKRLNERGFLASTELERGTLTVRRELPGGRRNVLHLNAGSLIPPESAQPTQPAQDAEAITESPEAKEPGSNGQIGQFMEPGEPDPHSRECGS